MPLTPNVEDVAYQDPRQPRAPGQAKAAAPSTRRRNGAWAYSTSPSFVATWKASISRNWPRAVSGSAAHKREDFATARLLTIRPAALAALAKLMTPAAGAPSLDDFAATHAPDGFYTERELVDLFAVYLTARAKAQRRRYAAGSAMPTCAPGLSDAGITTVGQLVKTMNTTGYRWYRQVPRPGETGARRIAAWLAHYGDVGGLQLDPAALLHQSTCSLPVPPPQRNPTTGIVPRRKVKLRWRVSSGSRRSLGWVPFKVSAIRYRNGQLFMSGFDRPLSLWPATVCPAMSSGPVA
jgi:hypothetical protein